MPLTIDAFTPASGPAAGRLTITGDGFSETREDDLVDVGGALARVVRAASGELVVLLDPTTTSGPVSVTIGGESARASTDYEVVPSLLDDEVGPPISFEGAGHGAGAGLPVTGVARVVVALVTPKDVTPSTTSRQDVVDRWATVHDFYRQASYTKLDLQVEVSADWTTLTGNAADYLYESTEKNFPNVDLAVRPRLMAEAARAVSAEFDTWNASHPGAHKRLDDFGMMAVVLNLGGTFIRAWGGWSEQHFTATDGDGVLIDLPTLSHPLDLLVIGESALWGRFAHETGHNLVDVPTTSGDYGATLGEDVYGSDLVDPAAATAQDFEMMGAHDGGPLFSVYHLKKLGWFTPANIATVQWTRNPYSHEFDVVAHGLTEDTAGDRVHVVEIVVTPSLSYFVEVRQRPDATGGQVFDPQIPLGAAASGGVVVTKTISGTVNQNQQTRFITLLHEPRVLRKGEVATDPARALRITVLDDAVQARPLVCRVRVEWAQAVVGDPNGTFDLRIDPWDSAYQSPDIWVDRQPYGTYDQGVDASGRPKGNGDRPRPNQVNKLTARIHNDGITDASDVRVTFYVVEPPGVGDNGNWAPLVTETVPLLPQSDFRDVVAQWVPVVGRHTCLRVFAEAQLGEISTGNNSAQENVFSFEAPASSPPDPVSLTVAVRNPSREERLPVLLVIDRVPEGYAVHLDHAWVVLDPLAEREVELWVVPTEDISFYERREDRGAPIRVSGRIPRHYRTPAGGDPAEPVASVDARIGGITAVVAPKRRGSIELTRGGVSGHQAWAEGRIDPAVSGVRVQIVASSGGARAGDAFVETDGGRFGTEFRIYGPPVTELQAFVVDSPGVSECESDVLRV